MFCELTLGVLLSFHFCLPPSVAHCVLSSSVSLWPPLPATLSFPLFPASLLLSIFLSPSPDSSSLFLHMTDSHSFPSQSKGFPDSRLLGAGGSGHQYCPLCLLPSHPFLNSPSLLPYPSVFEFMPYMGITLATIFTMLRLANEAKMRQVICSGAFPTWALRSGLIKILERESRVRSR